MVDRALWSRALLQLSTLHGDDLSRLPHTSRLQSVSNLHRPHHAAGSVDGRRIALVVWRFAVAFYAVSLGEPLALQRAELRPLHDVRAPGRSAAHGSCPACPVRGVHPFLFDFAVELSHRTICGSSICLAERPSSFYFKSPAGSPSGVLGMFLFWTLSVGRANRAAQDGAVAYLVFHAVCMVSRAVPTVVAVAARYSA